MAKKHDHYHHHRDWGGHAHTHEDGHHLLDPFSRGIVCEVKEPDLTLLLQKSIEKVRNERNIADKA